MPRHTFSLKVATQENIEKINPENIKLMERFLKEKNTRSSDKTIVVYRSNLLIFFCYNFLYNDNKFFVDIKKIEFADFFSYGVSDMKLGSARLNNLRSVLSTLSLFIEKFMDESYPNFRNVILKTIESTPKETRRIKTILSDEQVQSLLDHLFETDKQKSCWLALAITSGARFSELLRFDVDIIDENRMAFGDIFLETCRQIKTKGRGHGGKLLYKYILREKFLPYYKAWLIEREKIMKQNNQEHNSMFIKRDGSPITTAQVRGWIIEFEKFLGVPFYSHSLRHYLTTLLAKKNIPTPLIQEIFGWSGPEMVQLYTDLTNKDRHFSELDNFKFDA